MIKTDDEMLASLYARTIPQGEGCMIWQGFVDPYGHGKVFWQGEPRAVHRLVYCLHNNIRYDDLPRNQIAAHTCLEPSCIQIRHIRIGRWAEHAKKGYFKGHKPRKGKIPFEERPSIVERLKRGTHPTIIAEEYNVSRHTIYRIRRRAEQNERAASSVGQEAK